MKIKNGPVTVKQERMQAVFLHKGLTIAVLSDGSKNQFQTVEEIALQSVQIAG